MKDEFSNNNKYLKCNFRLWTGIVIALVIFVTSSLVPTIGLATTVGQTDASHTEMITPLYQDLAGVDESFCDDCGKNGACENSALCATACCKIPFYHPAVISVRWARPYAPVLAPENHWAEHIPSLLKRPPKSL